MPNRMRRFATAAVLGLTLTGCAHSTRLTANDPVVQGDFGTLTYRAVDQILTAVPQVAADTPLVVASISDVRNLDTTSALGNIAADLIRTRLVQDGYFASDIRLRNEVSFNQGTGEFLLSRDKGAVMPPRSVAAIFTGTYAVGLNKVYVSLKLISATDSHILAAADFVVPYAEVSGLVVEHHG